ncbi:MAG: formate--tetrahydrofolate ligase [Candidatus Obscuribacterales bacterium]|nr:formate--tetrahydrofolate ligase [Candidatus Obscuribacterales bacterium]
MSVELKRLPSDVELARQTMLRPITEVAHDLGLSSDDLELYGKFKAKVTYEKVTASAAAKKLGKLILVTAITPTKSGEGKTTVSVGLAQALRAQGCKSAAALREPSMGPVFGQKGGGTGGGYCQLLPMDEINLNFTGDLHAITSANNLLAAIIDNHIFFGNKLDIDPASITFRRCLDVNDRSLRSLVQGVGGKSAGVLRESGFDITAASEVMALLCLSDSFVDLKRRLGNIVVAQTRSGAPVFAGQLDAVEPLSVILKDAIKPNLVQTSDGTPAFVHGGPFANIAHGTSTVISSRLALSLCDYVVTESGFGADLGFEKFCDIVAASRPELVPACVVLVVTVKALKLHGEISEKALSRGAEPLPLKESLAAIEKGFANAFRHAQVIQSFGLPVLLAVNKFDFDQDEEIEKVLELAEQHGLKARVSEMYRRGAEGGEELAKTIIEMTDLERSSETNCFKPVYGEGDTVIEKLEKIARTVYGAYRVILTDGALKKLKWLEKNGFDKLPVCVAKTQYSFSDDPGKIGAPTGFNITVRELRLSNGAGFVVALTGDIMTMPGLPKVPAGAAMKTNDQGQIEKFY